MLWSDLVVSLSSKMFQKGLWCMRLYPQNQPLVTGPLQSHVDVGKGSNRTQKTNRTFMQITNSRKTERNTICKFLFRENNFCQLICSTLSISL